MVDDAGDAPTPFVISESTWAGLGADVQGFLLAARAWACPGPDRLLPGWRHNRPVHKEPARPAKLQGLVQLFQSAKFRAESGYAPGGYKGLEALCEPRSDDGTREVLKGLRPKQPPPRWQLDADNDRQVRQQVMASEAEADRAAIKQIERSASEEAQRGTVRTAEEELVMQRRERARQQAEARRAERLAKLKQIEAQEKEVAETLKVLGYNPNGTQAEQAAESG